MKNIIKILLCLRPIISAFVIVVSLMLIGQCAKYSSDHKVLQECIATVKDIEKCELLYNKFHQQS